MNGGRGLGLHGLASRKARPDLYRYHQPIIGLKPLTGCRGNVDSVFSMNRPRQYEIQNA